MGIVIRTLTPRATDHHGQRRSTLEQIIRKLAEGHKEFAAGKELEAEPLSRDGLPNPTPGRCRRDRWPVARRRVAGSGRPACPTTAAKRRRNG
jgi:hypothetical protein